MPTMRRPGGVFLTSHFNDVWALGAQLHGVSGIQAGAILLTRLVSAVSSASREEICAPEARCWQAGATHGRRRNRDTADMWHRVHRAHYGAAYQL